MRGTKNCFLIQLLALQTVSNVAYNLSNYLYRWQDEGTFVFNKTVIDVSVPSLSGVRDWTFVVAHWIYAYKYWICSFHMQRIIENKIVSIKTEMCLEAANIIMLLLVTLNNLYFLTAGIIDDLKDNKSPWHNRINWAYLMNNIFVLFCAAILFDALLRIRTTINKISLLQQVNSKKMFIHAVIFIFYSISALIATAAIFSTPQTTKTMVWAWRAIDL